MHCPSVMFLAVALSWRAIRNWLISVIVPIANETFKTVNTLVSTAVHLHELDKHDVIRGCPIFSQTPCPLPPVHGQIPSISVFSRNTLKKPFLPPQIFLWVPEYGFLLVTVIYQGYSSTGGIRIEMECLKLIILLTSTFHTLGMSQSKNEKV